MSPFVSPLSAIARAHDPTVIGSVALRKGPQRFCLHRSDHCLALILTCQTHPCDKVASAVIMFLLHFGRHGSLELDQLITAWSSCDMCVHWKESSM